MFGFVLFTGVLLACRGEPLTAPVSGCGGERRDNVGILQSPLEGSTTDCIWTLKADGAFNWRLDFWTRSSRRPHQNRSGPTTGSPTRRIIYQRLDKNENGDCANYVEVRDGGNSSAKILAKYCLTKPDVHVSVVSSGNQMWIKLHLGSENEFPGFGAQYSIEYICGGELREESGHLRSPLMRKFNVYPPSFRCNWKINVDGALKLTLKFTEFELEPADDHEGKCDDYVEVGSGEEVGKESLGKYCGTKTPFHVDANGGKMWIKFKSDPVDSFKGFSAKYWKGGLDDEPSDKLKPNES